MRWNDLLIATDEDVYKPSDDTFLLAEAVQAEVAPGETFLEVGCGAGVVAMVAARSGAKSHAVDRNPRAARICVQNALANDLRVDVAVGDLLSPFQAEFDVIAFNPPYLPTAPDEKVPGVLNLAFDGGPSGNDTVLEFAKQLEALPRAGRVLVIHSTLSDPQPLDEAMARLGYTQDIVARQRLPYEELTVRRYA